MNSTVDLQPFARQLISELELSPGRSSTARELIEQASLKLSAIETDGLSAEARHTHSRLGLAVGVLRNAAPEAASQAFDAVIAGINRRETSAFIADVNAAIVLKMELRPVFATAGEYFPTEEAARSYAAGLAIVAKFADIRTAVGEDTFIKLARGKAYLQHDPKNVEAARKDLLVVAETHFGAEARAALDELFTHGKLSPAAEPLKYAANRLLCTTADGKEFQNSHYVRNPPAGAEAIAAAPETLAFSAPKDVSRPQPWHLTPEGRPISVGSQLGVRAKELALANLDKHLQALPLDATSGPGFGELLRDTILAVHGEDMAKALEEKRWSNLFTGLRDEPIVKHVRSYVAWAAADTLAKFDTVTTNNEPALGVQVLLQQVGESTGSINQAVYGQLRQNLLDIEAGAVVASYVREATVSYGFHKLSAWARETREALERRQTAAEANAASLRFDDRS